MTITIPIKVSIKLKGKDMIEKLTPGGTWQVYAGLNGQTHFVMLSSVVGVKYPDPTTGGVVLRLANGQFISLSPSESLSNVMNDLGIA